MADWRRTLEGELGSLAAFLAGEELLSAPGGELCSALRQRLLADKLVLAFVAEFSRGKSELINAIFFADTGRRILPATPGRTTMCPVELGWEPGEPPHLDLLPIETRREGTPLVELRRDRQGWTRVALDPGDPQRLAAALAQVTRTQRVSRDVARELNLWSDERLDDNPPADAEGRVEVPAWRHAIINYPHPLLERGLVVLDTPGLNAIGAEPELTLGLLPAAHAALFLLGADAGVTKSDLAVWNEHLGAQALACFVVLNKVDTLADPLMTPAQIEEAVERQCAVTASTLQMPRERVFPVSARQALHARLSGHAAQLAASRLPALETALIEELLPARQQVLAQAVLSGAHTLKMDAHASLRDQRRQTAEQLLELRGLRGKSGARVRHLLERVQDETAEFERCVTRLTALRAVQARMLRDVQALLSADRVRAEVASLQKSMGPGWLHLGARQAFITLFAKLREGLAETETSTGEARDMLHGSFRQLNSEFGFSLSIGRPPDLAGHREELAAVERGYERYFGLSEMLRMASPAFRERFMRMLVAKLRMAYESAARDVELWHQSAGAQMEGQLRDRRRSYRKRREALERIQQASGELEERVADVQAQAHRIETLMGEVDQRCEHVAVMARRGPVAGLETAHIELPLESAGPA